MTDFHQDRIITTLHSLFEAFDRESYLSELESRLERHSGNQKINLLLPSLFAELENPPVLRGIVDVLRSVQYIDRVVVALGGAPRDSQFQQARDFFGQLRTDTTEVKLVWIDGDRVRQVLRDIQEREIVVGVQGKGQAVWMALGYIFARNDCDVVALHDCDIVTYDRVLLGRLIEPTANPNNEIQFCKGYYARISPTERVMRGRVTRLFVTPFVDAMVDLMYERGHSRLARFFTFHRVFKYPLAGEFSFTTNVARRLNIAYDWGLEVATLSQVYDQLNPRQIGQIDLAVNYEHKHQEISPDDSSKGLHRMVMDIAKFYLTYMRSNGFPLDDAFVDMMLHTYYQNALRYVRRYSHDAEINGLDFDLYGEEAAARHFRGFLWDAWETSRGPHEATLIPSWNRVCYSFPEIYAHLLQAVEEDNR